MAKKLRPFIPYALILLLIIGGIFYLIKTEETSIHIHIGAPLSYDEAGNPSSIYYDTNISRNETKVILLAMINALPLPQEEYPTEPCDAMIVVRDGFLGYPYQVWFTEDSIIYGSNGPDLEFYKEFHNDHNEVIPLIQNYVKILKNYQK